MRPMISYFNPHGFDTKVEFEKIPHIFLTHQAYSDMAVLVDEVDKEVGWLGTARIISDGFLIDEIFLVKQEVASTTTELDEDGIAELGVELLGSREDGMDVVNSIRFWGHSHVNMGTSPSGQDESQMNLFKQNNCDWFIRGIANKKGRIQFSVFYFKFGIQYHDVPWSIYQEVDQSRREDWKKQIEDKVSEMSVVTSYNYGSNYYQGRGHISNWPQRGAVGSHVGGTPKTTSPTPVTVDEDEEWDWGYQGADLQEGAD